MLCAVCCVLCAVRPGDEEAEESEEESDEGEVLLASPNPELACTHLLHPHVHGLV
jgi:hypothetical protein